MATTSHAGTRPSPSPAASIMYGIGLGGFVDGIVLHQVLQWHHLLSAEHPVTTVAGLELNTMADGFFHIGSWLFVVGASIVTLAHWRQGRLAPSWRFHVGGLLLGWGLFNLVEGIVDHQLLGIHHVRDDLGGPLAWDLGFLAVSALLVLAGVLLQRSGPRHAAGAGGA